MIKKYALIQLKFLKQFPFYFLQFQAIIMNTR